MINVGQIVKLDDNKEYYVLSSIINEGNNFIMIGEIDPVKDEITKNVKIMFYDTENDKFFIQKETILFGITLN